MGEGSDGARSAQPVDSADASLRLSKPAEWAARLALVAVACLVVFAFGEIALRLLEGGASQTDAASSEVPSRDAASHDASHGASHDESHSADGDATGDRRFDFFAYHPILGWDLVPGAVDRHQSDEFDVTVRVTAQGLRETQVYPLAPRPGVPRVVVLGDSFTFGHGVDVDAGWSERLERMLAADSAEGADVEVVNLAVTGYGLDQQLLRLEDRGLAMRPDLVLVGLFQGDVFRVARDDYFGYAKPRYRLDDGMLRLGGVPVSTARPAAPRSRLWALLGGRAGDLAEHLGHGEAWPVSEAILGRLREVSEAAGARVATVLIPKDRAVATPDGGAGWRRDLHLRTLDEIAALHARVGVPLLDLRPALEAAAADSADALYYPRDGHFTAAGHRIAAEAALPFVREQLELAQPSEELR